MTQKTISVAPETLLKFLSGRPLVAPIANVSTDAKIVKCAYSKNENRFLLWVEASSFDDRFSQSRMPQEFVITAQ